MKSAIACGALIAAFCGASFGQDPGWPRELNKNGTTLTIYQPQVDSWQNFTDLKWRMAVSIAPPSGKTAVGVIELQGRTETNPEEDIAVISNLQITKTYFPSLDQSQTAQMDQLVKTFLPQTVSISMRRLVACVPKQEPPGVAAVRNDPPAIFVSNRPAILLFVDGQPVYAPIPNTNLEYLVNTVWPLFVDRTSFIYYLLVDRRWMAASALDAAWAPTTKIPADMEKLRGDPQWTELKEVIPPPEAPSGPVPKVFFSMTPAEVILFDGPPVYSKIPGTQLTYATNTASDVFFYTPTQYFYYLTSGRWFSARSLDGPWTYATPQLPADFAKIPPNSPAGRVLAWVPGTDEAKDAVLLAQVPTTFVVNPATAAAHVKVTYSGTPQFESIQGTELAYATNTADKVIKVGDVYYLCLQGVWFMSASANGPWTTATSIPQEIYTIPPSSPVYNVTYVSQTVLPDGNVQASYTAGYLGGFILGAATGAIVASGTGYYYPPYIGYPAGAYPYYHPYAASYGATAYHTSTGAYGLSQTAYGPYGSATRAAQYNPYTGTYARSASVSTPYGSRSAAQAYNPYTGAYAAHTSGSSPTAQWGSSVVSKGGESAYGQHYSTAAGTAGSVQTSAGGKAAGVSTAYGTTAAGKTAGGDMYAGHDGNVYKNTGSGWEKYDNGSWNAVSKPSQQERSTAEQRSTPEGLNQEFQNRQRGAQSSQRFEQSRSGGFGGRRR